MAPDAGRERMRKVATATAIAIATAANVGVAVAKGAAAVVTGSAALMAQALHSIPGVHLPTGNAVYVGPARLLVVARIQLVDELWTAFAHELVRQMAGLREELLRSPAIAEVMLSIEPRR